nr:hypothetical protein [Tanacetum cinerariifolium]
MGYFARECRAPRSQDRGRREIYKQGSKVEESAPKALMAIDGVGWDWSYMANEEENHALLADDEALIEFALMAKSSSSSKNEEVRDLIKKEGLRYSVVPPLAQVYSPSKKDMSWTGLPEFTDDTFSDYNRPSPSIESKSSDLQNSNSSISEHGESSKSIISKSMIKFVKAADCAEVKTNIAEAARKPSIIYAEMYRNTSKSLKVRDILIIWHMTVVYGWKKGKKVKNNFAHENVTHRADLFKIASVSAARRGNTAAPRPNVNSVRPKTTQDLVIIKLIQRVKRLERELKTRTSPTKIQKVDVRGRSKSVMAWVPKKV